MNSIKKHKHWWWREGWLCLRPGVQIPRTYGSAGWAWWMAFVVSWGCPHKEDNPYGFQWVVRLGCLGTVLSVLLLPNEVGQKGNWYNAVWVQPWVAWCASGLSHQLSHPAWVSVDLVSGSPSRVDMETSADSTPTQEKDGGKSLVILRRIVCARGQDWWSSFLRGSPGVWNGS